MAFYTCKSYWAPAVDDVFEPFTTVEKSPFHMLLTKVGTAELTKKFHEQRLLPLDCVVKAPDVVGGENGAFDDFPDLATAERMELPRK